MSLGPGSSAILDLKAELLRKRSHAEAKGRQNGEKVSENTVRKGGFRVERREPKESRPRNATRDLPPPKEDVDEEDNVLRESRRRLEEKALQYETMKSSVGFNPHYSYAEENEDGATLVDFNAKIKLEIMERSKQTRLTEDSKQMLQDSGSSSDSEYDDDSEWTTFTDSLGRTRKCLKSDLDHFLREDDHLRKSLEKGRSSETIGDIPLPSSSAGVSGVESSYGGIGGASSESMKTIMDEDSEKTERIRRWAEVEQENAGKEHLHYRDILFDEVREHGQAHFEFSRNESERSEQLKVLNRLRDESARAQKTALEIKKRKQDLLQQRLNRIRERKGLPPAEPEQQVEAQSNQQTVSEDTTVKAEHCGSSLPTVISAPPPQIRPWDEGKEIHGVPIRICAGSKRSRPIYEDYVENRRQERLAAFAPPSSYNNNADQRNGRPGQPRSSGANTSESTDTRPLKREPTRADVDEFLKTMRNLP